MSAPYKVLIVDDEAEIRNGMGMFFPWDQVGFVVTGYAEDGRSALEFIQHNAVDVLCCDVRMPHMNGLELARNIKNQGLAIKIVIFTGYRDFEYAKQAISSGVRHYILKSAKTDELLQVFSDLKNEIDAERKKQQAAATLATAPDATLALSGSTNDHLVLSIKEYVSQHMGENVSLETIALHLSKNADYLGRIFKAKTGLHFSDFLLSTRMEKAVELLGDFRLKTMEIAGRLGYSNPKNFARAFRSYTGKSPREFRNEGHIPVDLNDTDGGLL